MKNQLVGILIAFFSFSAVVCHADTIHIPGDYSTIQLGINASNGGDTVLVADGTYTGNGNRDISFYGKAITVQSENGPENCIIDCERMGRGFVFISSENLDSILSGFTIINGVSSEDGGGIYITSSPTIENCIIRKNTAAASGGGVFFEGESTDPMISNCAIMDNTATIFGGGIAMKGSAQSPSGMVQLSTFLSFDGKMDETRATGPGPNVTVTGCSIAGNHASSAGGGFYSEECTLSLLDCKIVANNSGAQGGAFSLIGTDVLLDNSIIAGNLANNSGGGIWNSSYSDLVLTNCVFSCNYSQSDGGAIYSSSTTSLNMNNCSLVDNQAMAGGGTLRIPDISTMNLSNNIIHTSPGYAIYLNNFAYHTMRNNLFGNNPDGDYFDTEYGMLDGANELNTTLSGANNNLDGFPGFAAGSTGSWTEDPIYDEFTNRTTLTDATATYEEDVLAGSILNADTTLRKQTLITSNSATTLIVVGDLTDYVTSGDNYSIFDYHLDDGSSALDRALVDTSPDQDIEGDPRPGTDGLYDIGADEAPSEYIPPEDLINPFSYADPLPELYTSDNLVITYQASDAESGVQYVELYYRLSEGTWTYYDQAVMGVDFYFNASETGGNGRYDFYTVATDNAGNVEDPPESFDATSLIIESYTEPLIYLDIEATGLEIGTSWEDAFNTLATAMTIADIHNVPEIWTARGRYEEVLVFKSNIELYGSFDKTETSVDDRDIDANRSIIDVSEINAGGPAEHAVEYNYCQETVLDGFLITGGSGGSSGGGIYSSGSDGTNIVRYCVITGNSAYSNGGGVYCYDSAIQFLDTDIFNNSSDEGGGIYATQVYKTDSREIAGPSFTDSKISGNIAEKGGGFYGYKTEFSLNRCIVSGNTATISGGGFYSSPLSSLNSMNGVFEENRATGTNLTIINSLVAGNDAVNGGGLYNYDSNANIDNCTLVANTAEENGGGIHSIDDSDWTILNTIIVGNSAVAIYSANLSETALVEYNLFNNNPDGDYYDFR
ncbi:right-handed parallel beta-helix repeat-containing protein, partial [bacterium]|nr:right-handed parallel beta-helix repeat-containing protein [bacterium]